MSTRERIVTVAADAWHAQSFDGVGVAEICRRAKVHKGSFFHFFASKEALLLAVLDCHTTGLRERLAGGPLRADLPPLERLTRFFAAMSAPPAAGARRQEAPRGCPIGNVISELATRDETVRAAAARALDVLRAALVDVLRDAVTDASLPRSFDVDLGADALLACMQGIAVMGKAYRDPARLARLGAYIPALLAAAAGTGPPTPAKPARRQTKRRPPPPAARQVRRSPTSR